MKSEILGHLVLGQLYIHSDISLDHRSHCKFAVKMHIIGFPGHALCSSGQRAAEQKERIVGYLQVKIIL